MGAHFCGPECHAADHCAARGYVAAETTIGNDAAADSDSDSSSDDGDYSSDDAGSVDERGGRGGGGGGRSGGGGGGGGRSGGGGVRSSGRVGGWGGGVGSGGGVRLGGGGVRLGGWGGWGGSGRRWGGLGGWGGGWGGWRGRWGGWGPWWGGWWGLGGALRYWLSPWAYVSDGYRGPVPYGWLWDDVRGGYYNAAYAPDVVLQPYQLQTALASVRAQGYDPEASLRGGATPSDAELTAMRNAAAAARALQRSEYDRELAASSTVAPPETPVNADGSIAADIGRQLEDYEAWAKPGATLESLKRGGGSVAKFSESLLETLAFLLANVMSAPRTPLNILPSWFKDTPPPTTTLLQVLGQERAEMPSSAERKRAASILKKALNKKAAERTSSSFSMGSASISSPEVSLRVVVRAFAFIERLPVRERAVVMTAVGNFVALVRALDARAGAAADAIASTLGAVSSAWSKRFEASRA